MIFPLRFLVDTQPTDRLASRERSDSGLRVRPDLTLTVLTSTAGDPTLRRLRTGLREIGPTNEIVIEPGQPVPAPTMVTLQTLGMSWRELRAKAGISTLDTDPDRFVQNLIGYSGESIPCAVLMHRDGVLQAVIVAYVLKRRAKLRLGHAPIWTPALHVCQVSYGGLIVDPSDPLAACQVRRCMEQMLKHRLVDAVRVRHLDRQSMLHDDVTSGFDGAWPVAARPETHWFARLIDPATGEAVVRNSAKTRSSLRRLDRRLVAAFDGDVEMHSLTDIESVDEIIAAASEIGRHSYQWRLGVGVRDTPKWRSRLEITASEGRLRAFILRAHGQPIAYSIGDVYETTCISVAMAFDHRHRALSPGKILLCRVFEALIEEGIHRFDFGFGDAEYKRLHGTDSRKEDTVMLFGRGSRARLSYIIHSTVNRLNEFLQASLARVNMLTRVKQRNRQGRASSPKSTP